MALESANLEIKSEIQGGAGTQLDSMLIRYIPYKKDEDTEDSKKGSPRQQNQSVEGSSPDILAGNTSTFSANIIPGNIHRPIQEDQAFISTSSSSPRINSYSSAKDAGYQDTFRIAFGASSINTKATECSPSSTTFDSRLELDRLLPDTQSNLNRCFSTNSDNTGLLSSPPKILDIRVTKTASLQEKMLNLDHLLHSSQTESSNSISTEPAWLMFDQLLLDTQRTTDSQLLTVTMSESTHIKACQLPFDRSLPKTQHYYPNGYSRTILPRQPIAALLPETHVGGLSQDIQFPSLSNVFSHPQSDNDLPDTQDWKSSFQDSPSTSLLQFTSDNDIPDTQTPSESRPPLIQRKKTPSIISSHSERPQIGSNKPPLNKVSCLERKRLIVSPNRPPSLTKAMRLWLSKTHSLLDPFRSDTECWFHPSPPPPRLTAAGVLRPRGKIQKTFTWTDLHGRHTLVLNYGICSKLANHKMTKLQQDGWIHKQWHLSHLCGNWTCLNPEHATVEPGVVNIGRNNCFSHRDGCGHFPKCMKELKAALGKDGLLIDHDGEEGRERLRRAYHWDDWWGWE